MNQHYSFTCLIKIKHEQPIAQPIAQHHTQMYDVKNSSTLHSKNMIPSPAPLRAITS